jgi:Na+/H+ antiporter NhaD/arsenite permease-like protein
VTGTARVVVTLTIFATMLALVVVRPRRWSEAWWTMLGAAAMLALGLVSPRQAISATLAGKNALLFLLSLPIITPFGSLATMLVIALARREGHEVRTGPFTLSLAR